MIVLYMVDLKTYEKINEETKFTEEETVELLKLSEKEILKNNTRI